MRRSELYTAVWSQAPGKLAARLGISDTGLRTVCRRYAVPVPPRGYWAKVDAGKPVERTALPSSEDDREIVFRANPSPGAQSGPATDDSAPSTAANAEPGNPPPLIIIEASRGPVTVRALWPTSAAIECAAWVSEILRRSAGSGG
jgi:hypothetical protein